MRHLRVFNFDGDLIADMPNVTFSDVTNPGVLIVKLAPVNGSTTTLRAFAPGFWAEVVETPTALPSVSSTPIVPGAPTDADIATLMETPDAAAIRAAMTIHCTCDALRCTSLLNPASAEEKESARIRWRTKHDGPPDPAEPLQRCVRARGHDQEALPCYWALGVWTYGAAEHHPACPRHPSKYNNPSNNNYIEKFPATTEEGQPQDAAGFTSTAMLDDPSTTLVRPLTEAIAEQFEPYLAVKRAMWNTCAVPGPDADSGETWCTLPIGHDGELHEQQRSGERISWLRHGRGGSPDVSGRR